MKLTIDHIKELSKSYPPQTPLSIFASFTADGESKMEKNGDKQKFSPEEQELLALLQSPQHASRFVLQKGGLLIEKYTYRCKEQLILAENDHGSLSFRIVEELSQLGIQLSDYYALSTLKTADIYASLTPEELMVLLAVCDHRRQLEISEYLTGEVTKDEIPVDLVIKELTKGFPGGLVKQICSNYHLERVQDPRAALHTLSDKGCLTLSNESVVLAQDYDIFARSFLLVDTMILSEVMQYLPNDILAVSARMFFCAGVHDILSISQVDGMFEIRTLSGAQLWRALEAYLSCPNFNEEKG